MSQQIAAKDNGQMNGHTQASVDLGTFKVLIRAQEMLGTQVKSMYDSDGRRAILLANIHLMEGIKQRKLDWLPVGIQAILKEITLLNDAASTLAEGAQAQIAELDQELEESRSSNAAGGSGIDIKKIKAEITRRIEYNEQLMVSGTQEALEDTRSDKEAELASKKEGLRLASSDDMPGFKSDMARLNREIESLKATIDEIVAIRSKNNNAVQQLRSYLKALELIAQGLPENILGAPLPELPNPAPVKK